MFQGGIFHLTVTSLRPDGVWSTAIVRFLHVSIAFASFPVFFYSCLILFLSFAVSLLLFVSPKALSLTSWLCFVLCPSPFLSFSHSVCVCNADCRGAEPKLTRRSRNVSEKQHAKDNASGLHSLALSLSLHALCFLCKTLYDNALFSKSACNFCVVFFSSHWTELPWSIHSETPFVTVVLGKGTFLQ